MLHITHVYLHIYAQFYIITFITFVKI